jgi:hypothetical protein
MALRLTGIPTPDGSAGSTGDGSARPNGGGLKIAAAPTPQAAATPQSPNAFGAQLRDQARLHLTSNQLERYRALFESAAKHEDSQAR